MGGFGSGGGGRGQGRKPKSAEEKRLGGHAGHRGARGKVLDHPSSANVEPPVSPPAIEVEEFDAPDDLTIDERHVWLELAPHAFAALTLTKGTSLGFRLLCRNIVLERRFALSVMDAGGASHRGLIQRVDAELLRFGLAPCGKPIVAAPKAEVDPMQEKYFGRA